EQAGDVSSDGEHDDGDDNYIHMRRARTWAKKVTIARRHLRMLGYEVFWRIDPERRSFSSGLAMRCIRENRSDMLNVLKYEKLIKGLEPNAQTAPYYGACLPKDLR
ncbi:hypothetical protein PENTCL1PPCAC_8791, partial [Pristionchus entomophagus]